MDLFNLLIATATLINLSLGVLVYYKRSKKPSAVWFGLLAFVLAVWCGSILGARIVASPKQAVIWVKLIYATGLLIPTIFFYFANLFPRIEDKPSKLIKLIAFVPTGIFLLFILFTNCTIGDVVIPLEGEKIVRFGFCYPFYLLFMLGYFSGAFYLLTRNYLRSKDITRIQLRYVLLGTGLATLIALATNLILPTLGYFTLGWTIGPLSTVLMALFITYAILRHHLLDLKVISIEILAGLIVLVSLVDVILSQSLQKLLFRIPLFVLVTLFAYLLVRGVFKELEASNKIREQSRKIQKQAQKLQRANAKLRQLDKLKTLFLSIASHQLRTPLTGIKGYVGMIIDGNFGNISAKVKDILENVYANTNRLIRLVNTFLNVSRIESGKFTISREERDLVPILKKIVAELRLTAKDKGLKLSLESKVDSLAAEVDADKIEDVLINLVDNALKYTPEGGEVKVKLADLGNRVRVEVKDTGQGLKPSEIKRLFNKFVRGSRALDSSGTGLGLYIAKRIIEAHKGEIGVESDGVGRGSCFWVEFPKK